jgi:hypothetical protein
LPVCPYDKSSRDMRTNMERFGEIVTREGKPNYSRDKLTSAQFCPLQTSHTDWSEIREITGRQIDV